MGIEAVIFDRDNTLFDTEHTLHRAYQETLSQFGIPGHLYTWKDHQTCGASTTLERCMWLKERFGISTATQVLAAVYREYYLGMFDTQPIRLIEGAKELVELLHSQDFRLAVVTNGTRIDSERYLKDTKLNPFFATVVTIDDITAGNSKPHPEPFLLAAQRLDVEAKRCAVIGDSEADIIGAKRAGMMAIHLYDPKLSYKFTVDEHPDLSVLSLKDISPATFGRNN